MRKRDYFDVGLVYVWILTVFIWLFTFMAAFVVRGVEALSVLVIAIVYSVLNRFKAKHRLIRSLMVILLVLACLSIILLFYDIISAFNASPKS